MEQIRLLSTIHMLHNTLPEIRNLPIKPSTPYEKNLVRMYEWIEIVAQWICALNNIAHDYQVLTENDSTILDYKLLLLFNATEDFKETLNLLSTHTSMSSTYKVIYYEEIGHRSSVYFETAANCLQTFASIIGVPDFANCEGVAWHWLRTAPIVLTSATQR